MIEHRISQIRSFNRTVSQTVGALQESYLGRGRPLGESRLLFEIGEKGAELADLRVRLDLDSGYLSRLLRSLEQQGLVRTTMAAHDRRIRCAQLTAAGREELAELNSESDQLAESMMVPLNESQRRKLLSAMSEVERLLTASAVRVTEEHPKSAGVAYCLARYFEELVERFDEGFDVERCAEPSLDEFVPPHGTFVVMRLRGKPVGCGGFKPMGSGAVYLKRMWIDPDVRGLGLGRRLLLELERRAAAAGRHIVRLETHKALAEAQRLYRQCGYREIRRFNDEPYAHHWFEKTLD